MRSLLSRLLAALRSLYTFDRPGCQVRLSLRQRLPLIIFPLLVLWYLVRPSPVAAAAAVGVGLLLLLSYLWARSLARSLNAGRHLRYTALQVGDELEEQVTLTNASILPLLWAELIDHSNLPNYSFSSVRSTGANSKTEWRTHTICSRRGVFTLGPWQMRSGDPFGMFLVSHTYLQKNDILVYPPLAPLPSRLLPHGQLQGEERPLHQPLRAETQDAFTARPYQPGDPLRHIHWPITARHESPYVKVFEPEDASTVWLLADLDAAAHLGLQIYGQTPLHPPTPSSQNQEEDEQLFRLFLPRLSLGKKRHKKISPEFGLLNESPKIPTPDPSRREGRKTFMWFWPRTRGQNHEKKKFPAPILGAGPGVGAFLMDFYTFFKKAKVQGQGVGEEYQSALPGWNQGGDPDSSLETMILLLASLASALLQQRVAVGLLAYSGADSAREPQVSLPSRSPLHLWDILRTLALLEPSPHPFKDTLEKARTLVGGRDQVLAVTPALSAAWLPALHQLNRGKRSLSASVILLDPASFTPEPQAAAPVEGVEPLAPQNAAEHTRTSTAEIFAGMLARQGVHTSVVRRGELHAIHGAYGELSRWEFKTLGTGRVVVRHAPRPAQNSGIAQRPGEPE